MRLLSMNFAQFEGLPKQWRLFDLSLDNINLLVGKNATGKSRTLSVIVVLAKLLESSTKLGFESGNYKLAFEHEGSLIKYDLHFEHFKVLSEQFSLNDEVLLRRGEGGFGEIRAEKEGKSMQFQAPDDQLAAVVRQDSVQHPFLAPLRDWARTLYFYPFSSPLGKDQLIVETKDRGEPFDPKDFKKVVSILKRGLKEYPGLFKDSVLKDMREIGYPLRDIGLQTPTSIVYQGPIIGPPLGLYVHEDSLVGETDQIDMSQGMFRALSVIIQITYAQMSNIANTIIIDDIGEGLDFERSCALIKLITTKAKHGKVQLLLATNDRFVMNSVPLEAWSLLQRSGGDSQVFNYSNSKSKFDAFKFTGMNNFDFFATDFLSSEEGKQN